LWHKHLLLLELCTELGHLIHLGCEMLLWHELLLLLKLLLLQLLRLEKLGLKLLLLILSLWLDLGLLQHAYQVLYILILLWLFERLKCAKRVILRRLAGGRLSHVEISKHIIV